MKMLNFILIPFLFILFGCSDSNPIAPVPIPVVPPKGDVDLFWEFEKQPAWEDEFNYEGLPNPAKWGYDIGGSGWGNNELQYYTKERENAYVANGVLSINALKKNKEGKEYTSARLVSKNKGDFLFGRFEIKAKLPTGRGTWVSLWLFPTDNAYGGWPRSGEIDIIEHVGYNQNKVYVSVHTKQYNHMIGTHKTASKGVPGVSEDFHLYRVDWTPYAIRGYVDNIQMFEYTNDGKGVDSWPFDKKFHFIMNLAVGGNWGGTQGVDPTVFPKSLEIDYVRVYNMIPK